MAIRFKNVPSALGLVTVAFNDLTGTVVGMFFNAPSRTGIIDSDLAQLVANFGGNFQLSANRIGSIQAALANVAAAIRGPQSLQNADFTINSTSSALTFNGGASSHPGVTGPNRAVQAGDIIELAAGVHGDMTFTDIDVGSDANRTTIRGPQNGSTPAILRGAANHSGGFAHIIEAVEFCNIDGSHDTINIGPDGLGRNIQVKPSNAAGDDNPSSWIKFKGIVGGPYRMTQHIMIKRIELDGGWPSQSSAGIGISAHDHAIKLAAHPGQWVDGIDLIDNYIHNCGSEGYYFGPNPYMIVRGTGSEAGGRDPPLRNCRANGNYMVDISKNAIEPKSWFGGVNEIAYNFILRAGTSGTSGQGNAIAVNGSKVQGIHDNWLQDCGGGGIVPNISEGCRESDPTMQFIYEIYNNVLINSGTQVSGAPQINAIAYGGGGPGLPILAAMMAHMHMYNNTIVSGNGEGIDLADFNSDSWARNNIVLANATNIAANVPGANNLTSGSLASIFVNPGNNNYRLSGQQGAVGTLGVDIALLDYLGNTRGGSASKGAYEFS